MLRYRDMLEFDDYWNLREKSWNLDTDGVEFALLNWLYVTKQ